MNEIVPASGGLLANLERYASHARGAYAANTERALKADTAIFTAWCQEHGRASLPAAPETVCAFIDAMAAEKAPATVRRYASSIATYHRAAGLRSPTEDMSVKLALKRMHREKGRRQKQAPGLVRSLVDRMIERAGDRLIDKRNVALLTVAYDTLCRRSELVALDLSDVTFSDTGDATVLLRRSKTDAEGQGMIRYLAPDTTAHLRAWIEAAGIAEGRLFRSVNRAGLVGESLHENMVPDIYKRMAKAAGYDVPEADIVDRRIEAARLKAELYRKAKGEE